MSNNAVKEHLKNLVFSKSELNNIYNDLCEEFDLQLQSEQKVKFIKSIVQEVKNLFSIIDPRVVKPANFKSIVDTIHKDTFDKMALKISRNRKSRNPAFGPESMSTRFQPINDKIDDDELNLNLSLDDRLKMEMQSRKLEMKNRKQRPPTPDMTYDQTGKQRKNKIRENNYEKEFDPLGLTDGDVRDDENEILNLENGTNNVGIFNFGNSIDDDCLDDDIPIEELIEKEKIARSRKANGDMIDSTTTDFRKRQQQNKMDLLRQKEDELRRLRQQEEMLRRERNDGYNYGSYDRNDYNMNNSQISMLLKNQEEKFMRIINSLQSRNNNGNNGIGNNGNNGNKNDDLEPRTIEDKLMLLTQKKKEIMKEANNVKQKYNEIQKKEDSVKNMISKFIDLITNNINAYNKCSKSLIINSDDCKNDNNVYKYCFEKPMEIMTGIKITDYSFPSFLYNISTYNNIFYYNNDSDNEIIAESKEVQFLKKNNLKIIAIAPGEYEHNYLCELFNSVLRQDGINLEVKQGNKFVHLTSENNFNIFPSKPNNIFKVLGFTESSYAYNKKFISERSLDLRSDKTVNVFFKNINPDKPICSFVHNSGIINQKHVMFSDALKKIDCLEIEFKNSKGNDVYIGGDKTFMIEVVLEGEYQELPIVETKENKKKISEDELQELIGNVEL